MLRPQSALGLQAKFQRFSFGSAFAKLFDVLVGHLNRANKRFAFAHAVTIRAARYEELMLVGDFEVMLGYGGGMLGVKTFYSVESGSHQTRNHLITMVQAGMRENGHAAGLVDEFNSGGGRHFKLRNPSRPILFKIPLES